MSGRLAQEMLRIIYCSTEERFNEIFGEDGNELWFMYRYNYSGNQGRLLVEMTTSQAEKLAQYTINKSPGLQQKSADSLGNILGLGGGE